MANLHVCMAALYEMTACQIETTGQIWQAAISTGDVVGTSSNCHYLSCKYSFPKVCHNIGFANKIIKVVSPNSILKMGRPIFITHKTIQKYYKIGLVEV